MAFPKSQQTRSSLDDSTSLLADARSALMDSIRSLALERHFSRAALKDAETFALNAAHWHGPVAWYRPHGSQAEALDAEIIEPPSARARMTVYLYAQFGETAVESSCTCGARLCSHAAALLVRLRRLADWPRAMTPLQRWQYMLKSPARKAPRREPALLETRTVICLLDLLEESGQPLSSLAARLVVIDSPARMHERECWIALEELPVGTDLPPRLALWQARLGRGARSPRGVSGGHELRGPEGAALLAEWLQAGMCRHSQTLQNVHEGPPRRPHWEWSLDQQARAHLRMQLADDGSVHAIDLDGIHYLDESSGELGSLVLDPEAWSMVERLPAIPPGDASLRDGWPPHPLLRDIPPPPLPVPLGTHQAPLEPVLVIGAARRLTQSDFIFHVRAWADYGGCRLPLAEQPWQEQVIRQMAGEFAAIRRDVAGELAAKRALGALELVPLRTLMPDAWRTLAPAPAADAMAHRQHHRGAADTFAALESVLRGAPFRIECDPQLPFVVLPPQTPLRASFREGHSAGWTQFQLTAACEEGDIDILPVVLKGLQSRAFSLSPTPEEHGDSRWLAPIGADRFLPLRLSMLREWLTPLLACATKAVSSDGRHIDLPARQAMSLSATLQRQDVAVGGPQASRIMETLAALRAAQKTSCGPPTAFRGSLREYQKEGLHWLQALRRARLGGILADDMGLGKTVQIIAHLSLERESGRLDRPALVVASTTLVPNWLDELARFAPDLRCLGYTGAERARQRTCLPSAHVIVVSYALLNHEMATLQSIDYSMIVLDEAQWIKNPFAQTARAIRALRAPHVIAVTGTPLENHLGELWSHMDATNPGYLGDYRSFNHQFRNPIERREDDRRLAALRHLVSPFVLRRTKAEVAPELPPKTEAVLRVVMADEQRSLYESLRLSLSQEVRAAVTQYTEEQSRIVVLAALMRLRQVCCDPRLIEKTGAQTPPSAKLDALLALIRSLLEQRRHVLVFSQFTSMLDLIARALEHAHLKYTMLTGRTADRRAPVREFQSGKVRIMLASLKAGGLGLNLTAADAVVHYDPWWNPAVERQAADRAHRLGREQPVFVYKLICEDTIEEKIAAMKDRKSDLALAVLGEKRCRAGRLSDLDLRELLDPPGTWSRRP